MLIRCFSLCFLFLAVGCTQGRTFELSRETQELAVSQLVAFNPVEPGEAVVTNANLSFTGDQIVLQDGDAAFRFTASATLPEVLDCMGALEGERIRLNIYIRASNGAKTVWLVTRQTGEPPEAEILCADIVAANTIVDGMEQLRGEGSAEME